MRTMITVAAAMAALLGSFSPSRADESAEAYVRRMAEAGRPDLAEARANEVLDIDLAEPVSKAVLGALRAKRGDVEGAVADVATAVLYGADEPFVRRTAGQILAWHDTRTGTMADDMETSLETMRRSVGGTPECDEAYSAARDAYVAARSGTVEPAKPGVTLVADSVEAEFAGDSDTDVVIYAFTAASCGVWWNCVTPSCRTEWCSAIVRTCGARSSDGWRRGTRFASERTSWGRYGSSFGRSSGTWSTPLGTFSGSFTRANYGTPAASCAPAPVCEPQRGG